MILPLRQQATALSLSIESMTKSQQELIRKVRDFVDRCKSLQLATVAQDGRPHASYAPFYRSDDGDFHVFVSTLSSHTDNLSSGVASILLIEDESRTFQIYARTRLGFSCECVRMQPDDANYQAVLDRMEQRHGAVIQTLRTLADFRLFRLRPGQGRFVLGFGQAYEVTPALDRLDHIGPS